MPNNRAVQFKAFDALVGLKEAIKERERIIVEEKDLSVEDLEDLNYKLKQVKKGMVLTVEFYDIDNYVRLCGVVTKVDLSAKYISIVKKKIYFKDIFIIEGEDINIYD